MDPFRGNIGVLVALLFLAAAAARASGALCDKSDKAALLAVKSALGDPPYFSGWKSTVGCCSWRGISCNATTGRVTDLTIYGTDISAPIPAAIANLTALQNINLAFNQFYGRIPDFLGPHVLPDLNFLRLDGNILSGAIPPTVTVSSLLLALNELTGPLPATFADADFDQVDFIGNQLTGDASILLGAKKRLSYAGLSRNRFSFDFGLVELPEAINALLMGHDMVYGSIPAAAAERTWDAFDVSYNQLCGPIPQGQYAEQFGVMNFQGNKCLCGGFP